MLPLSMLAWPVLAWMTLAWIADRPVHWVLPAAGTLLAVGWLIPSPIGAVFLAFVAPGVALALYLVSWHIWRWRRAHNSSNPTRGKPRAAQLKR